MRHLRWRTRIASSPAGCTQNYNGNRTLPSLRLPEGANSSPKEMQNRVPPEKRRFSCDCNRSRAMMYSYNLIVVTPNMTLIASSSMRISQTFASVHAFHGIKSGEQKEKATKIQTLGSKVANTFAPKRKRPSAKHPPGSRTGSMQQACSQALLAANYNQGNKTNACPPS